MKRMLSICWVVKKLDLDSGGLNARVYQPHKRLLERGYESRIISGNFNIQDVMHSDAIIFHRTTENADLCMKAGKIVGIDVSDDLYRFEYKRLCYDFLLTDSIGNVRLYHSADTHYWPHGYHLKKNLETLQQYRDKSDNVSFVYCGYPENVHGILGPPLKALERVAQKKKLSLTIITNTAAKKQKGLPELPLIKSKHFPIIWKEWGKDSYEEHMMRCDVGFFPQNLSKGRWRRKSIYKIMHAASLGLPAIASPTIEAQSVITNGLTALLAESEDEWYKAAMAMCDREKRLTIAKNVMELCRLRFGMDNMIDNLTGIIHQYIDTINRRSPIVKAEKLTNYVCDKLFKYLRKVF